MRPWLSVIMPTYNGAAFLGEALASVVAQQDRQIEVIAVDDGSTDGTLEILRRFSRRLRLTIMERSRTGNWVASTIAGMAFARGRYLCWFTKTMPGVPGGWPIFDGSSRPIRGPRSSSIHRGTWTRPDGESAIGTVRCDVRDSR